MKNDVVVFTTATADRFPHAVNLVDSIKEYNPDIRCIIGVVDYKGSHIYISNPDVYELLFADDVEIPNLEFMSKNYNSFELATSFKSIFGCHIINTINFKKLLYLDSDILVYNNFESIFKELEKTSIIITPHFYQETDDSYKLDSKDILMTGLFNTGFVAINNCSEGKRLYTWWLKKCTLQGFNNPQEGMFVDQLWFNFVPLLFKSVSISKNLGLNVGYWNLHERKLSLINNQLRVNREFPLIFYHYSGYKLNRPDLISIHQNRHHIKDNFCYEKIFSQYKIQLEKWDIKKYDSHRSQLLDNTREIKSRNSLKNKIKRIYYNLTN